MVYKNFRLNCTLRVLFLCILSFTAFWLWFNTSQFMLIIVLGILIVQQIVSLIRYVEKTNRDLSRFIEAIKYEDISQSFDSKGRGTSFDRLSTAFSDVAKEIKKARSEKEEQYRYLQTVIQHVGIGLISFQQNGEIELINTAAKKLINVSQVKNIKSLSSFSKPFVDALLRLASGERALVNVNMPDKRLQLALNATEFVMRNKKFTLVSIQDIESELERERMSRELEIAHQVQMSLLPKESPRISGFDIAGSCIPAEEVGGDYYDFIHLQDGRLGIVVADVSGKGMAAAIYMTLTKGVIQSLAEEMLSPKEVLSRINALIYQSIDRKAFVSMFYTILDPIRRQIICSRAGHNPAVLFNNRDDNCTLIQPDGIALGLEKGAVFTETIREEELELQKGDVLVMHTDGFTEAMDHSHAEYGEERLREAIRKSKDKNSKVLIEAVSRNVKEFTESHPQHDDMTMVSIRVN